MLSLSLSIALLLLLLYSFLISRYPDTCYDRQLKLKDLPKKYLYVLGQEETEMEGRDKERAELIMVLFSTGSNHLTPRSRPSLPQPPLISSPTPLTSSMAMLSPSPKTTLLKSVTARSGSLNCMYTSPSTLFSYYLSLSPFHSSPLPLAYHYIYITFLVMPLGAGTANS